MKNKGFIYIPDWMYELGIDDFKALGVYSIIYSFSQDGTSCYNGNVKFIADKIMCHRNTIDSILKKLVNNGYLLKDTKIENNITFNSYRANMDFIEAKLGGASQKL